MPDLLKAAIKREKNNPVWQESKNKVVGHYGRLFHPGNLKNLTREEFLSFLHFKNNLHWDGIHRQGGAITKDMRKLKKALAVLLDESKDIKTRLNFLFPKKEDNYIRGLGKAVVTPILLVVYPDKYAVWNSRSEGALKKLGLFPKFPRGASFADKYLKINRLINELALRYSIDLWQLDGVFGEIFVDEVVETEEELVEKEAAEKGIDDIFSFGMEKHLEDFLIANWERTIFGRDYKLIFEEGDLKSQQYPTSVGPIDILAVHKKNNGYLVIELKKGRSTDSVIGQISRYIAWVEENLAKGKKVKGVIIVSEANEKIRYSLKKFPDADLYLYRVKFNLEREKI
jgi:hypothetical protein